MRFTWKKRKLLKRYIITYVLVFAVPLVIFSYIIYQQSVKIFSQQYIETSQTAAKGVSRDLARLLDLAESTANSVRGSPYFSSSNIKDFAGSFIYIDQRMSELSSLNKDFFEIAFYSDESDLVYTSSTYKKSSILNIFFALRLLMPKQIFLIYRLRNGLQCNRLKLVPVLRFPLLL